MWPHNAHVMMKYHGLSLDFMFVFTILSSCFFFSFVRVHLCVSSMPLVSWFLQLELHGSPLESHTSQGRLWNGKLKGTCEPIYVGLKMYLYISDLSPLLTPIQGWRLVVHYEGIIKGTNLQK